jgi:hypothetical protein
MKQPHTSHGSKPAGKGPKAAGKTTGKGKAGKSTGKGTERETHAPPTPWTPEFRRTHDQHKDWNLISRNGRSLYYWRINTSLYEVALEIGGPTAVRTWDDIHRFLDGTLVEEQANREAL